MDQPPLFSSGQELAKLVVSSRLLHLSWRKTLELCEANDQKKESKLGFRIYSEAEFTILAFVASTACARNLLFQEDGLVNSSSTLMDGSSLFKFLCSKNISSFSIHSPAIQLFASAYGQLSLLKSQLANSVNPLIITGYSLGGSVASLFTLWLLDTNKPGTKRPLCITFGSPLIGDISLQQILENSIWNSCFLHMASTIDPIPKLLLSRNLSPLPFSQSVAAFKPFGTFLLCSETGCACFKDPDVILELLAKSGPSDILGNPILDVEQLRNCYTRILERFLWMSVLEESCQLDEPVSDSLRAGIILKLEHVGIRRTKEHQQNNYIVNNLILRMVEGVKESREKKKAAFDPSKKLSDMKIILIKLYSYKRLCREKGLGYYDYYKKKFSEVNVKVEKFKRELTNYWKRMVEEAKKKPQCERAAFGTTWLYGGTSYRRMIEPLDIADYYKDGLRDYRSEGRSEHYIQLEKWLQEDEKPANTSRKQDLFDLVTFDSCFWADVEEAMILCDSLENERLSYDRRTSISRKLIEFESYVMKMIKEGKVSPEIFLMDSSFMTWWDKYEKVIGNYSSEFTWFMKTGLYNQYGVNDCLIINK